MPSYSKHSRDQLATCHPDIRRVFNRVIRAMDVRILEGHRGEREQNAALAAGTSTLAWPNSRHNTMPSRAVDVVPWHATKPHIRWNDLESFRQMGWYVKGVADGMGVDLKWGGDWKRFVDMPHFELEST